MFHKAKHKSDQAFTLVELLVVIAIIGVLVALLLPAVQSARGSARRVSCQNRIKQLALALQSYEQANGHFPAGLLSRSNGDAPAVVFRAQSFGWGALILPQIEQTPLYDFLQEVSEDFVVPRWWDPNDFSNDAAERVIDSFVCPSDTMGSRNEERNLLANHAKSNYVGVIGPKLTRMLNEITDLTETGALEPKQINTPEEQLTIKWPGILYPDSTTSFREITDGSSQTLLLGERDGDHNASTWCGTDFHQFLGNQLGATSADPLSTLNAVVAYPKPKSATHPSWNAFGSQHPGGAYFARADGSVYFIAETIDGLTYERLGAKADGGVVGEY